MHEAENSKSLRGVSKWLLLTKDPLLNDQSQRATFLANSFTALKGKQLSVQSGHQDEEQER